MSVHLHPDGRKLDHSQVSPHQKPAMDLATMLVIKLYRWVVTDASKFGGKEVRRAEAWSVCRGRRLVVPGASGNGVVELWLEGEKTGDGWVGGRYRAGGEPGRCSLRDRRWFQALVAWYQNCRLFRRVGLKVRFVL